MGEERDKDWESEERKEEEETRVREIDLYNHEKNQES